MRPRARGGATVHTTRPRLGAATLAALLVALVLPLPAHAAAKLDVDPSVASPGQSVEVEGEKFPSGQVTLFFDGTTVVGTAWADDDDDGDDDDGVGRLDDDDDEPEGEFAISVTIPSSATAGSHTIVAVHDSGTTAAAGVEIETASTTTSSTTSTTSTTSTSSTTSTTSTTTSVPTTTVTTAPASTGPSLTTTTTITTTTGPDIAPPPPPTSQTTLPVPATTTRAGDDADEHDDQEQEVSPVTSVTTTTTTTVSDRPSGSPDARPSRIGRDGSEGPEAAPDLAGASLALERLEVTPTSGPPGTMLEVVVEVDQHLVGLTALRLSIDGSPLGEQIMVASGPVVVRAPVPDLPPGQYDIALVDGVDELGSIPFGVTAGSPQVVVASTSPPLATGLVVASAVMLVLIGINISRHHRLGSRTGSRSV